MFRTILFAFAASMILGANVAITANPVPQPLVPDEGSAPAPERRDHLPRR
jgi:hypothetical protein